MPRAKVAAVTVSGPEHPRIRRRTPSARTSFALSPAAMQAMDWLVRRIGPPKVVFEEMAGTVVSLILDELLARPLGSKRREGGSTEIQVPARPLGNAIRKSFVIGSHPLWLLNKCSKGKKVKRDLLVDYCILSLKKSMEEADGRLYEKQKKAQELLHEFNDTASRIAGEIGDLLGEADPIYRAFTAELGWIYDQVVSEVDGRLEDGEPITGALESRYE